MDEQNTKKQARLCRSLAALLGLALGILVFAVFLDGTGRTAEEQIRRVVTVLPEEIRVKGEELLDDTHPADDLLEASGIIQAEQVSIASELGGRIANLLVAEGDTVTTGDLLAQLDTTLLDAQIEAAKALLSMAEAGLAQAQAGARPGQITIAQAQLAQAETGRIAAQQAVSDTLALVENPQDIQLQVAVTYAQTEAAQHYVAQAEAIRDAAEVAKNAFENAQAEWGDGDLHRVLVASGSVDELAGQLPPEFLDLLPELKDGVYTYNDMELHIHGDTYELYTWTIVAIPLEFHLTPNQWWQAWVGVNAVTAQQEGIQSSLYHLYTQQEHPQMLEAQVDEALSALAQAEAQIAAVQAQVDGLEAGAAEEQIAALEARVAQAQVAVEALETQRTMMRLKAPLDGTVVSIVAYPGEIAAQGATLLTIADLNELDLVVYVPENRIGRVQLGQDAQITVDSFPGRVFEGKVSRISNQAEFTPRNVTTQEERVHLVFAIEIRVTNQDGALKPGMPADVVFGGGMGDGGRGAGGDHSPRSEVEWEGLNASGTIQAREIRLASELGGRILEVRTEAGEIVEAGAVLITLDATPLLLQLSLAEAAVATAQADLALVQAGPRPEEITAAQAALALVEAQRDGALAAWGNAQEAIENPQELDTQIAQARTQAALAEQGIELAKAELAGEMLLRDQQPEGTTQRQVADLQVRAAEEALAAAQSDHTTAQRMLNWLWVIRNEPLSLIAQAHFAEGQYRLAEAGVAAAQAQLDDLLDGPTPEEIAVAEAAVRQAEAEANVLRTQVDQLALASPIDGIVLSQALRAGELAAPAATILTLADLSEVTLVVYAPENRIGRVQLGQPVQVTVDSFPSRIFDGQVTRIGDEPEFTPRNVATAEERLNTFYAVEIRLPNLEGLLKPGMPADAVFGETGDG